MTAVLAAFDFDGTLTRGDTLVPFLRRVCGGQEVIRAVARLPRHMVLDRRVGRNQVKTALLALLRGRSLIEIEAAAERFADEVVRSRLRPSMVQRLEWHRGRGDRIVVVSASPEIVVRAVARRLGVDTVLATRLETDAGGLLTGRLDGLNVRGVEKVNRLRGHLCEEEVEIWAYGDSAGDRELLAQAAVAVWVGRRRRFSSRASGRST